MMGHVGYVCTRKKSLVFLGPLCYPRQIPVAPAFGPCVARNGVAAYGHRPHHRNVTHPASQPRGVGPNHLYKDIPMPLCTTELAYDFSDKAQAYEAANTMFDHVLSLLNDRGRPKDGSGYVSNEIAISEDGKTLV